MVTTYCIIDGVPTWCSRGDSLLADAACPRHAAPGIRFAKARKWGPNRSPAKRVRLGEEEPCGSTSIAACGDAKHPQGFRRRSSFRIPPRAKCEAQPGSLTPGGILFSLTRRAPGTPLPALLLAGTRAPPELVSNPPLPLYTKKKPPPTAGTSFWCSRGDSNPRHPA